MKTSLLSLMLLVIINISNNSPSQIISIDHAEASTPNGYVLDDIKIQIKFEKGSNDDTKIYIIPEPWKVSYKYKGKNYSYGSAPFTSEEHKGMFEPIYTSFYIHLSNGTKLKASIWPKATEEYYYYDLLCCESSYEVSKIEFNTSQAFTNANIERIIDQN